MSEENPIIQERQIYEAFQITIILKAVNAVIEVTLGLVLLFTNALNDVVGALLSNELLDDPNGFFATHVQAFLAANPKAQLIGGLYLLCNGVVKGILAYGLLKERAWAYPSALGVLSIFILYQSIRFISHPSLALLLLTLFDLVVLWLIYHEYRLHVRARMV